MYGNVPVKVHDFHVMSKLRLSPHLPAAGSSKVYLPLAATKATRGDQDRNDG